MAQQTDADLTHALPLVQSIAKDTCDVAFLILPNLDWTQSDRVAFARRVEVLRAEHQRQDSMIMTMEGFGPWPVPIECADADVSRLPAEFWIPFFRQAPFPSVQLTRRSKLESIRRGREVGTEFWSPSAIEAMLTEPSPEKDRVSIRDGILSHNREHAVQNWRTAQQRFDRFRLRAGELSGVRAQNDEEVAAIY